jgi:hypothetical protein
MFALRRPADLLIARSGSNVMFSQPLLDARVALCLEKAGHVARIVRGITRPPASLQSYRRGCEQQIRARRATLAGHVPGLSPASDFHQFPEVGKTPRLSRDSCGPFSALDFSA